MLISLKIIKGYEQGLTPLTHAILYGKNDIADLLRAAGAKE